MSQFTWILTVLSVGVMLFSFVYTWNLARGQKKVKENIDSKIPIQVQEHIVRRNPVFLGYIMFVLLAILMICVFAMATRS
ncbi:hypothetical protein [Bacillus sp. T33-2]|uniref:hypothetical protein n=1 Tax=Bacillus sp. T33-2 TaxID=2054168 RepID=UPI000C75BD14|nr:hypothetical protein [Bacillus sp. T33-2]PLR97467.1 hypothetical protein CVD19_08225 [Bacillus sp. T33-2]